MDRYEFSKLAFSSKQDVLPNFQEIVELLQQPETKGRKLGEVVSLLKVGPEGRTFLRKDTPGLFQSSVYSESIDGVVQGVFPFVRHFTDGFETDRLRLLHTGMKSKLDKPISEAERNNRIRRSIELSGGVRFDTTAKKFRYGSD